MTVIFFYRGNKMVKVTEHQNKDTLTVKDSIHSLGY